MKRCVLVFSSGIDYDIVLVGGFKSMFFGGEGILLMMFKGIGMVWI